MTESIHEKAHRLDPFVLHQSATILDALVRIDLNRKGFLIVLDDAQRVYGTLTDGDVRRAFIRGADTSCEIQTICTRKFRSLPISEGISMAAELFKAEGIQFIPILDEDGKLANILTKGQMQTLLLYDLHADLSCDFFSLDERILDNEIYHRPWGFYKTTILNHYFQSKIISVKPGGKLSLQSHDHREEYWIVVHGEGQVQIERSILNVRCGSMLFIPKGAKHRLTNTGKEESLIITEVQIGEYLGEDDIIRYEDAYGRSVQDDDRPQNNKQGG